MKTSVAVAAVALVAASAAAGQAGAAQTPDSKGQRPHACPSVVDIGRSGRDPFDAVFVMARGATCAQARQAARTWRRGRRGADGIVAAAPWSCRRAGDRIRCIKRGAAVSFGLGDVKRPPPREQPGAPTVRACGDVSVGSPGPAGQATVSDIFARNLSCDEAWSVARHVLCHGGTVPDGWQPLGPRSGIADRGARRGDVAILWHLDGVTDGSGCG